MRAQRSDATPLETINAIQGHWAASTRASPDKRPIAVMMCEDGGKVRILRTTGTPDNPWRDMDPDCSCTYTVPPPLVTESLPCLTDQLTN